MSPHYNSDIGNWEIRNLQIAEGLTFFLIQQPQSKLITLSYAFAQKQAYYMREVSGTKLKEVDMNRQSKK
jgi:hypothetical protein